MSLIQWAQHRSHIVKREPHRLRILTLRIPPEDFRIMDKSGLSGTLNVEMCSECGYVERANCEHVIGGDQSAMRWSADETQLICVVCGCDGT